MTDGASNSSLSEQKEGRRPSTLSDANNHSSWYVPSIKTSLALLKMVQCGNGLLFIWLASKLDNPLKNIAAVSLSLNISSLLAYPPAVTLYTIAPHINKTKSTKDSEGKIHPPVKPPEYAGVTFREANTLGLIASIISSGVAASCTEPLLNAIGIDPKISHSTQSLIWAGIISITLKPAMTAIEQTYLAHNSYWVIAPQLIKCSAAYPLAYLLSNAVGVTGIGLARTIGIITALPFVYYPLQKAPFTQFKYFANQWDLTLLKDIKLQGWQHGAKSFIAYFGITGISILIGAFDKTALAALGPALFVETSIITFVYIYSQGLYASSDKLKYADRMKKYLRNMLGFALTNAGFTALAYFFSKPYISFFSHLQQESEGPHFLQQAERAMLVVNLQTVVGSVYWLSDAFHRKYGRTTQTLLSYSSVLLSPLFGYALHKLADLEGVDMYYGVISAVGLAAFLNTAMMWWYKPITGQEEKVSIAHLRESTTTTSTTASTTAPPLSEKTPLLLHPSGPLTAMGLFRRVVAVLPKPWTWSCCGCRR